MHHTTATIQLFLVADCHVYPSSKIFINDSMKKIKVKGLKEKNISIASFTRVYFSDK